MDLVPWSVVAVLVGGCISVVGALIVLNLRSIKKCIASLGERIDKQDDKIEKFETGVNQFYRDMTACKVDCDRTNVSKEDWVRSDAFTRQKLDNLADTLNRMNGKLQVIQKLPEICGNIAREIAAQINMQKG